MDIKKYIEINHDPIPLGIIATYEDLIRDIQGQLMLIGLLDPPIDGKFGPVSRWALNALCQRAKVPYGNEFNLDVAKALLYADKERIFPLTPNADFAGRVIAAMQKNHYWINRHPDCLNIIYVEGCDLSGTANANKPNEFNDVRLLISVNDHGIPALVGAWEGTTEPGRYWTMDPMDPHGAARIAFGQYKAWAVGTHHAGKPSAHEALVQVDDITVYRDLDKNFKRAGDKTYTGIFAINQHWGYDMPKTNLGQSSAGCLVGREKQGHKEFMNFVKKDPRHLASAAYRYISTIMPVSDL